MNSTPAASTNILSHSLWMAFFNPIYLRCNVCETKNHLNIIIEFFRHKIIRGSYNMTKKANWLSQTNVCVNIILYLSKGYTKIMFNRYRPAYWWASKTETKIRCFSISYGICTRERKFKAWNVVGKTIIGGEQIICLEVVMINLLSIVFLYFLRLKFIFFKIINT